MFRIPDRSVTRARLPAIAPCSFEFRSPETNDAAHRWFGISPEGIGTMGMLLDFAVAIAVAALTPPPSQRVQQLVEDIRVPRAARSAAALDAE